MILGLIFILGIICYFIPLEHDLVYGIGVLMIITLALYEIFDLIPYKKPIKKSFAFCLCMWSFINACTFSCFYPGDFATIIIFIIELFLYLWMLSYSLFRSYEISSDEYKPGGVYLIFKTPKNFADYLHSSLCRPTSSVSVVADGIWYGYTLGQDYRAEKYEIHKGDKYLKVDISAKDVQKILGKMIGAKWGMTNNCCHAAQRIFKHKFGILDSFPSKFSKTVKNLTKQGI